MISTIEPMEVDKTRTVSTLLNADSFSSTEDCLEKYVLKNNPVNTFLRIVGVIWALDGVPVWMSTLQYVWNMFIRFCLFLLLLSIFLFILLASNSLHAGLIFWCVVNSIALLLQLITLLLH